MKRNVRSCGEKFLVTISFVVHPIAMRGEIVRFPIALNLELQPPPRSSFCWSGSITRRRSCRWAPSSRIATQADTVGVTPRHPPRLIGPLE